MKNQDWIIPSFFKHSLVKSKYVFDENPSILEENILIDYDTPNYIRIMKKFTTPIYTVEDDTEQEHFLDNGQKSFFLRCYLPKRKILQEKKEDRIKDIVIMINGLNETLHFDFYDQLGSHFAANNIASILIPTPYHLNRRRVISQNDGENEIKKIINPIDLAIDNPLLFYYNFKRSIHEIENLCDRIHGVREEDEDCGFYDSYFARGNGVKVRITLFGYSLGGLRALGCFMKANQNENQRFHSCIAFNSTANLFKAEVGKFKKEKQEDGEEDNKWWKEIDDRINKAINSKEIITSNAENELIYDIFKWLYCRSPYSDLVKALKEASKKFLMVQSGADKIVSGDENNFWNITDPAHGLNRIMVAGVDHIVAIDNKWHHYLASVVENLMEFIRNANDNSFSHQDIKVRINTLISNTTEYIEIQKKYTHKEDVEAMDFSYKSFNDLIKQIHNTENRKQFIELYYQSKGYYPKFPELLSAMMKKKSRDLKIYEVKYDTELRCGPSKDYQSVFSIKEKEKVKLLGVGNDLWLKVEIVNPTHKEKMIGYIESDKISN